MMVFKLAKLLLLINASFGYQPAPKYAPGIYEFKAKLLRKQERFLLRMQEHTRSPIELILVNAKVLEALDRVNTEVKIQVEVKQAINGNDRPYVHFKKWLDPQ
jgi:hypothetical protein